MAGRQRIERLREEFKKEASDILRKVKDPRLGFVTITDVEVSRDLRHVKVYFSVLGDTQAKESSVEALERATGFIRTELGQRIRLRYTPEIVFRFDESLERGARILQMIQDTQTERGDDHGTE